MSLLASLHNKFPLTCQTGKNSPLSINSMFDLKIEFLHIYLTVLLSKFKIIFLISYTFLKQNSVIMSLKHKVYVGTANSKDPNMTIPFPGVT